MRESGPLGNLKEAIICCRRTCIDKEQSQDLIDLQSSRDGLNDRPDLYTKVRVHSEPGNLETRNEDSCTDALRILALQNL